MQVALTHTLVMLVLLVHYVHILTSPLGYTALLPLRTIPIILFTMVPPQRYTHRDMV